MNREDYNAVTTHIESYFSVEETFGLEEGFNVGAAITSYDGDSRIIEDPTIGTMEFILKEYGPGIKGIKFTTLPNKPCVLNNVNGTVSESDFYPLDKDYEGETITYGPKLKCMNVDKLELLGNYDTAEAKTLMVAFVKCDSKLRNDCKTEEEIHEWLTFRYIIRL